MLRVPGCLQRRRKLLLPLLIASCASAAGCGVEHARATPAAQAAAALPVRMLKVQRGPMDLPVRVAGTLGATHVLELSFKVGGVVTEVPRAEGERVRRGQLLAVVDPTEIEAQLTQARQTLDKAKRDTARIASLQETGSLPMVDAQNAATGLAVASASVEALEFNLHHSRLVAPEGGVLERVMVHVGEVVAPGRPVFRLSASGTGPVARVQLIDRDLLAIKLGDSARVSLDARPEHQLTAHVTQIASAALPGTGTFTVELAIRDREAAGLPSGLTVKVEIEHREADTVRVPIAALVEGHGHDAVVYTVADNAARQVPVVVRQLLEDSALLVSLPQNVDRVVVAGASELRDGVGVRVVE